MLYFYRPNGKRDIDKKSQDMKTKSSILFFSFVGIVGVAFFLNRLMPFNSYEPNPQKESVLIRSVIDGLNRLHFQPKPIDDTFSKEVYNLYLRDIDGGKRFFTQSDIDQISQYETMLDDQAGTGSFDFFNRSVELLDASLIKTQGWYREVLSRPMDFSKDETLETEGKKLEWAKSDAELRNRWEKWMKFEVLFDFLNRRAF